MGTNVVSVAFSPDGKLLASISGGEFHDLELWDISSRKAIATLQQGALSMAFSPDGKLLASGSKDKTIKLWDVAEQKRKATLKGHTERVFSVAFSPDGKLVASGSEDATVKLWDVAAQKEIASLQHKAEVIKVAFHPSGKLLASSSADNTVRLWNVAERKEIKTLQVHETSVAFFSPDGKLLTTAGHVIKLWQVESWKEIATLEHSELMSVAFSPDGRILASGGGNWTMVFWDVESQRPIASDFRGGGEYICTVVFSPDGKLLASCSEFGLFLWTYNVAFRPDGKKVEAPMAKYFPVGVGNTWTYCLVDGSESTVSITEKREIGGNMYYNFKGKPDTLYRVTSEGVKGYASDDSIAQFFGEAFKEDDEVKIEELKIKSSPTDEFLWLKFPLEVGVKWSLVPINISFKMVLKEENISINGNLVVTVKASVVGSETITTPAGTFNFFYLPAAKKILVASFKTSDFRQVAWSGRFGLAPYEVFVSPK